MARLAELLEGFARDRPPGPRFKAPEYDGTQDVELFIRPFQDVARANQWQDQAVLLHLRRSLTGKATDCGDGPTPEAILVALRLRFGITARQARDKLRYQIKDGKTSWHEFGATIERLVNIAYAELPAANRAELALDNFGRGIDNRALQRHLLAVPPANIAIAITTAEEFLQVGSNTTRQRLNAVDNSGAEEAGASVVQEATTSVAQTELLKEILVAVMSNSDQMVQLVKQLKQKPKPAQAKKGSVRPEVKCYDCGGNHYRNKCPQNSVNEIDQENSEGPQEEQQ